MSWGKKITFAYLTFVVFMVGLVYVCIKQKDLFLVTPDYYKEELAYQEKIDAMKNTDELSEEVAINYTENSLLIAFPEECLGAQGQVTLYRPSDASKDFKIPFKLAANSNLPVATSKLDKGLWTLKLSWNQNNKEYYLEQKITL
jgi:hypothetical protein